MIITLPFSTTYTSKNISNDYLTLEKCLQHFTREEILDTENRWYCNKCKKHVRALKTLSLWKVPEVLIIGLKRFEFIGSNGSYIGGYGQRQKLYTNVVFPLEGLDLKPFMARHINRSGSRPTDGNNNNIHNNNNNNHSNSNNNKDDTKVQLNPQIPDIPSQEIYDLFGVINHYGRMGFGHYTAYARSWEGDSLSEQWYQYDDDDVRKIDSSEVQTNSAYVLFYRRRPSDIT